MASSKPTIKAVHKSCAAGCGRAGDKKCADCRGTFYCGKDCQKAHWTAHKGVCATLKNSIISRMPMDREAVFIADHNKKNAGQSTEITIDLADINRFLQSETEMLLKLPQVATQSTTIFFNRDSGQFMSYDTQAEMDRAITLFARNAFFEVDFKQDECFNDLPKTWDVPVQGKTVKINMRWRVFAAVDGSTAEQKLNEKGVLDPLLLLIGSHMSCCYACIEIRL